jgi:hypothetical protein
MRFLKVIPLLLLFFVTPIAAQTYPYYEPPPEETSVEPVDAGNARRLFVRFVEDAAIIPGGWIEGQFIFANDPGDKDRYFLGPLIAFRVGDRVEAGLRFGFLRVDIEGADDGSGLSDIDLYAKYRFRRGKGRAAIGALFKAGTGDEDESLGTGEHDLELFLAWRADLEAVTLTANAGVRFNGNPGSPFPATDDSVLLGGGIVLPVREDLSFVVEATYESERIDGAGADTRLTLGAQGFGLMRGFGLRGAVSVPLSDNAPDYQFTLGAVFVY